MQKPIVLLLGGGTGKRFAPFVTNKTLFPFFDKPLLQHVLESFQKNGLTNVLIITNDQNEEWLKKYHNEKIHIKTLQQERAEGMGAAMLLAEEEIGDRPVIVSGMHIINDQFIKQYLDRVKSSRYLIAAKRFNDYFPGGYLQVKDERVLSVIEKPKEEEKPSDLVKMVFDYFSSAKEFINLIKGTKTENDDQYEKALDLFMKKKMCIG